jgi:hypothetical protein
MLLGQKRASTGNPGTTVSSSFSPKKHLPYYYKLVHRPTKMSPNRRFFVGGNFKLNPISLDAKSTLIGGLNEADLDLETGGCG